jgi:hypothetical protein
MAEVSENNLPADLAAEVNRYLAEGSLGDLNDYLNERGVTHPRIVAIHRRTLLRMATRAERFTAKVRIPISNEPLLGR